MLWCPDRLGHVLSFDDRFIADRRRSSKKVISSSPHGETLEAIERNHILRVLHETNWVISGATGAAATLGLPRTTLINKMRKLGIARPSSLLNDEQLTI